MKSNNNHIEKEIFKIKNRITKVLPNANDVDIRIDKNEDGLYESLIKVHVPRKKELIASKQANTIKKCLDKSHQAIARQINKIKKKSHRRKFKLDDMNFSV